MSNVANKGITKSMFIMLLITLLVIGLAICLMPTVHAAEADVETWTACGTCEWGIDPDGCLWIRPTDGVSGTLEDCGSHPSWSAFVTSVVVKPGVSATTCYDMFYALRNCTSMDLSGLNTSSVTDMRNMFHGCNALTSLDLSSFDTSNVTDMSRMFEGCESLTSLDVSGWNTNRVTGMGQMFNACRSLTSLDLSGFNTSNVTAMNHMFGACDSLTELNIDGFDTSNVTNMGAMFNGCSSLMSLNVSGFDTGNVTSMDYMFANCSNLTSLDVSSFDTSKATYMNGMFSGCSSLTSIDVTGFDTSHATTMAGMFAGCSSLTSLDLSSFSGDSLEQTGLYGSDAETGDDCMLYYRCTSLKKIKVSDPKFILGMNEYPLSDLPEPNGNGYTGKWINTSDPNAPALTVSEIAAMNGVASADWSPVGTWVWETEEVVDPNATEFNAALILDQNASVPNASVAFTAAAGTGMAAVPGTSLEVLAPTEENGVTGTPTVGSATFAAGDETVTAIDNVTIGANQKAVVKPVSVDFNGVTFAQPGIFRYLITEPSTGSGLTYDTQLGDAENGVRYQRVLDVYVQRVDNADTGATSYQIAGYVFHEVANAPAVGATAAADKSSGFVHEYDTKTVTLESRAAGNQSSIDKYFAYTITIQNPNDGVFTVSADWTNAADALNPTANPATKYDAATITAANTAEWTSNADGSLSKTIYLRNGQKVELDGIPAGATYAISVADEDYSPSWAIGSDNGETNATGNRVLNALEDVVFTLTREGVVPTGVALSLIPGLAIMAGALVAVIAMRKRKEGQAEA